MPDLRPRQIGALEAFDPVDQDVGRPVPSLQAARGEHERLRAHREAEAVVDRRRHDQVDGAVLVLEQHEGHALRGGRPLARHDEPGHPHPPPMLVALELLARAQIPGQPRPHQLERMLPQRDPGRPVIRKHPLPRRQRPQLRPLMRLERQRQLSPLRYRNTRNSNPKRPQRPPPPPLLRPIDERITSTGPGKPSEGLGGRSGPPREIPKRPPRTRLPLSDQGPHLSLLDPADVPEPQPNGEQRGRMAVGLDPALRSAPNHTRRQHLHPPPLRLMHQ